MSILLVRDGAWGGGLFVVGLRVEKGREREVMEEDGWGWKEWEIYEGRRRKRHIFLSGLFLNGVCDREDASGT